MRHKAAVIGTGFIGPVHVEGLRRAGVDVVGILGSSAEKSARAAKELAIPRAYQSVEELVDDPSVDVVHITSPNQAHFAQASACLRAQKHVLCEKPLAMNSEQSEQLVRLAAESGLAAGVNYNIRYYPLCVEAAGQRKQGLLGDIYHITGSYVQDWLFYESDFNWRVLAESGGALRAVADIGTHWLDLVHAISGLEVESVFADLQTVFRQRQIPAGGSETFTGKTAKSSDDAAKQPPARMISIDTEDYGAIMLRFRGGARGLFHVSQVTAGRKNCLRWEIAASKHSMAWNSETPNALWIGNRDQANASVIRDPSLMQPRAARFASYPGGHNEGFPDTFKQLFSDFYESIESGTFREASPFPTFADGHREILLCEAILASARDERWVQV